MQNVQFTRQGVRDLSFIPSVSRGRKVDVPVEFLDGNLPESDDDDGSDDTVGFDAE